MKLPYGSIQLTPEFICSTVVNSGWSAVAAANVVSTLQKRLSSGEMSEAEVSDTLRNMLGIEVVVAPAATNKRGVFISVPKKGDIE